MKSLTLWFPLAGVVLMAAAAQAQTLQGPALVQALQKGGYVIVMRHAASPRQAPAQAAANADNTKLERQLDEEGRKTSAEFGKALRDLKIPIGEVLVSPTYRAMETMKYAQLSNPKAEPALGDNGQDMQGGTEAQAVWTRTRVTRFSAGTNAVLVTHAPNLTRAFPDAATALADGEALIFGSDSKGGATVVARLKIDEWAKLAR